MGFKRHLYILSEMVDCYVALGGNQTNTLKAMRQALRLLRDIKGIDSLSLSKLYETTPVTPLAQPNYLNAVCRFDSLLSLNDLWRMIQNIEKVLGKTPKPKSAPRLIDLDLLFYGSKRYKSKELIVPHPLWQERLFVLAPLADVTNQVPIRGGVNMQELLTTFPNPHRETIMERSEELL